MLASLDELAERMPSLLDIDHPCVQRQIADARRVVQVCIATLFLYIAFFWEKMLPVLGGGIM